jgi:hypothetical protein
MPQVDDTFDTLTEELWQDVEEERRPASPVPSARSEGRIAHFFNSLAASMALQQRKPTTSCRHQQILYPTDILAQNYPHLYLRVMCG